MSSASASIISRPVTLEQLTALSDEIGALARAGVPLDRGLRELSCDMPGRLGKLAGEIGRRLEAGGSLSQVIGEMGSALPPAYRCVVEAGVRAGRLPMAMEGISQTARRIGQLRNSIYLSLLYPLMVLLVTWGLGVFVLMRIGPVLSRTLVNFDVAGPWIVDLYDAAARHSTWAGPLIPLVFGVWLAWAWYRCGRLAEGRELHPLLAFGAVGVLARLQRASRLSSLADLLSLLIANEVPLSEAVELASAAVGSAQLAQGGKKFAEQLRCGEVIDKSPAGFPPVLAWTLAGGQSQPRLVRTLSRAAEVYRDEVARRSQWLMIYVPLFATIGICGSLVCLYTLMTLGPWIALMRRISEPY